LPYVLTLIAVAGVIGRSVPPAAAGRPYVKQ
jgi:general nucleoside transport system permease protein